MTARILVVDDDPAVAEMIGIVLRADGFERDAQAAVEIGAQHFENAAAKKPFFPFANRDLRIERLDAAGSTSAATFGPSQAFLSSC